MGYTFKGEPVHLVGRRLKEGMTASDFRVVSKDNAAQGLAAYSGKIKVITTFLSLDTPVCDLQVRTFNEKAVSLGEDVHVLAVSNDLPFAQKRFCQTHGIENVDLLSDYRYASFGLNYGLVIKEMNLLARSVIIIDKSGTIRYLAVVGEATEEPSYAAAMKKLEEVTAGPGPAPGGGRERTCAPCEGKVAALTGEEIEKRLKAATGWKLVGTEAIRKHFTFKSFGDAEWFIRTVAVVAEEEGHHPGMDWRYNRVDVTLTTHAVRGLSRNDFIMARLVDEIEIGA
jgi:thiol peroxidase